MAHHRMAYDDDETHDDAELNVAHVDNREVYYSDIVGDGIRDAITGARYPWKVGSFDERRFFKVRSTIAYANHKAKGVQDLCGRSARQAFYETPFSYMNHQSVVLSDDSVKDWYNKANALYPGQYNYPGPNGLENS
jgi:hypothetical protein